VRRIRVSLTWGFAVATPPFGSADDLPSGLTYEFDPEIEYTDSQLNFIADLEITEAELTDDGLVSTVLNSSSDKAVTLASITGVCFAADGTIAGYF
jgi:hypothetical protein